MENEIAALKKLRANLKGSITRQLNFVRDIDPNDNKETIDGFKSRLNRVNEWFNKFNDLESQIFRCDANEASLLPDVENSYFSIVNELNAWIRKRNVADGFPGNFGTHTCANETLNISHTNTMDVKLPKINIPPFTGNYMEWQSFYDLFVTTIHEKDHLTASQKFQYLKSLLKDEPAALLRHYNVTEANYREALQKLCQRYDRKKHIVNSFIKSFVEQGNVSQESASGIRKIWDHSDEVIRGLKALGPSAELRDPWIIYIIINKLDPETKSLWAQASVDNDYPTIEDLFMFLAKRTDALESVKSISKKITPIDRSSNSKSFVTTKVFSCPLCKVDGHKLFECVVFKSLAIDKRRELIKTEKRCFNCLNFSHNVYTCKSKARCFKCNKRHHTLLHEDVTVSEISNNSQSGQTTVALISNHERNVYQVSSNCERASRSPTIVLPTALVDVQDASGQHSNFRALLDSASQESFVTEECVQHLGIRRSNGRLLMKGLGDTSLGHSKGKVRLTITGRQPASQIITVDAYIVPKIASLRSFDNSDLEHSLQNITLADPQFNDCVTIDILLGTQVYYEVTKGSRLKLSEGLVAEDTIFGWIIAGRSSAEKTKEQESSTFTVLMDIDTTLRRFWEIEAIPQRIIYTEEEQQCENWFVKTTIRNHDGRFIVKLPYRNGKCDLGSSRSAAVSRLFSMERRFKRDPKFHELYSEFMNEYKSLAHMEEILVDPRDNFQYYLPHHGVLKESSTTTKLRVVFDASTKSSNAMSLNDNLLVGPTIQSSLFDIILRFRQHKFVFVGDLEKMYRQILVDDTDSNRQRILWRTHQSQTMKCYKLKTLTYGTASASFIATRCLKELALQHKQSSSEAASAIEEDMYVDDLMTGAESESELVMLRLDICRILESAQMNLRKIISNSTIMSNLLENNDENCKIFEEQSSTAKVLGLFWNANNDRFSFQVNFEQIEAPTKRIILSEASKIFDPIGWLSPVIIRIKILFQNLWRFTFDWDEKLPNEIVREWNQICIDLRSLNTISIPRWIETAREVQLHGFCDASQLAYSAVIYARAISSGNVSVNLLAAKTRVAPIKQLSIPRLELMGAVLLTDLMNNVKSALKLNVSNVVLWTDSKIVLDWLNSHPRKWSTFVGNRTSIILESYSRRNWLHVLSGENPADAASRGLRTIEFKESKLWWNGPSWLKLNEQEWPEQTSIESTNEEEKVGLSFLSTSFATNELLETIIGKYSSFHKMKRILALVLRYCSILKNGKKCGSSIVTPSDIDQAMIRLISYNQQKHYMDEIRNLQSQCCIPANSSILSLHPFLDNDNILRVGGRIDKAMVPYTFKHPIILSQASELTEAIIRDLHEQFYHAGHILVCTLLRQQFHVIRAKDAIRNFIRKCVVCTKANPPSQQQLMGDLPICRVELTFPFYKIGVDYAGPFKVHIIRRRGAVPIKAYACFFVCLATKAVHIEAFTNPTTENFLGALARFTDRRGLCSEIFSDNGSNFIGADRQMKELYKFLADNINDISFSLLRKNIKWNFNPPGSPCMGGIWEASVKSAKYHLKRSVGESILTLEEFTTLLTDVEAILNSRPLYVSASDECEVLTPAHFLIGRSMLMLPERDISESSPSNRWDMVKKIRQHFWHRWHRDYLPSLNHRSKWTSKSENIKVNDMVLIRDDKLPSAQWSIAKVIDTKPGLDGLVRIASLKTATGITTRHISKLSKIPIFESGDSRRPEC